MGAIFLMAFGLGIAICLPPGPIIAEAIRRGTARGFRAALALELGSIIGDITWAVIALIGAAFLVQNAVARLILGFAGVGLLLWLAWGALRDAWTGHMPKALEDASHQDDFRTGAAISLANPQAIAFWLTIGGSIASTGLSDTPGAQHFTMFFAGYLLALILYCFGVSALVAWGRRFITPTVMRGLNVICALALSYFAVILLSDTLRMLFA